MRKKARKSHFYPHITWRGNGTNSVAFATSAKLGFVAPTAYQIAPVSPIGSVGLWTDKLLGNRRQESDGEGTAAAKQETGLKGVKT